MEETTPNHLVTAATASSELSASMTLRISTPRGTDLTERERAVLELLAFGLSNKEIAQRLALGRRTVETHVDHVLRKLDVPSRKRAVSKAGELGLLGSALSVADGSSQVSNPNNLPYQLTTLFGREQDIEDVKCSLQRNRLVTLTGSGGVGKTRLAFRVGVDLIDRYPEGVWVFDFSPISDPKLVQSVVAKVLGVREHPNRTLLDSITRSLTRKHALLIFDNCEHVLDPVAELVDEILHSCPNVCILSTSRQALGIIGEVVYRVRSLEFAERPEDLNAEEATRYGAIALFADRAKASEASFAITNDNAPIIAAICRRLDGIPLAIELAAARVATANLHSLARSLDDRFKVLVAGSRTALPRHKTLSALIDWSYDRLSPQEQRLFARLGTFAGSFTLQAATVVCAGDGLDEAEVADLMIALAEKSLVVLQIGLHQERYRMLETIRAYALQKSIAGDERQVIARRHTEYFCKLAQEADEGFGIGSSDAWLASVELDLENYRAALAWALTRGNDKNRGSLIAGCLRNFWHRSGLAAEGRRWILDGLEQLNESEQPKIAAALWRGLGILLGSGEQSYDAFGRAFELYESVGDILGTSQALYGLAVRLVELGRLEEASVKIARVLAQQRELGYEYGVGSCLTLQANISFARGEITAARDLQLQSIAIERARGDEANIAPKLCNLAEFEFAEGHVERALDLTNQALELLSTNRESLLTCHCNCSGAAFRLVLGDLEGARKFARAALRWSHVAHESFYVALALQHLALLAALCGQAHIAARLVGFVDALRRELGRQRDGVEKWGYEKLLAELHEQLGKAEAENLVLEGTAWSEDRAIDEALKL